METIYLEIKVKKSNKELELIRENGILFDVIADSLNIDRNQINEIETNNKEVKCEKIRIG
jgi:hypothetical protein